MRLRPAAATVGTDAVAAAERSAAPHPLGIPGGSAAVVTVLLLDYLHLAASGTNLGHWRAWVFILCETKQSIRHTGAFRLSLKCCQGSRHAVPCETAKARDEGSEARTG